jgi:hypothetical protein
MTEQNTSFVDFLETHPARLASDSTKKWLAEFYLAGYAAGDRAARQECAEICSKVHLLGTPNNFQAKICKERIEATIKELTTW